jgi:hypothetical protein
LIITQRLVIPTKIRCHVHIRERFQHCLVSISTFTCVQKKWRFLFPLSGSLFHGLPVAIDGFPSKIQLWSHPANWLDHSHNPFTSIYQSSRFTVLLTDLKGRGHLPPKISINYLSIKKILKIICINLTFHSIKYF